MYRLRLLYSFHYRILFVIIQLSLKKHPIGNLIYTKEFISITDERAFALSSFLVN